MKLKIFLLLMCILFTGIAAAGCAISLDLPEIEIPLTSTIYDAKGQTVSSVFEQNRIPVSIEEVSTDFLKSIVAIEDHRFFQHNGIDLQAVARAIVRNIKAGATVEGGSTITQQTAKNLFLTPERTYTRKLKELVLTFKLERQFTKREILEKYINLIYFGHGAYGIEIAARTYFDKSARDLTLGESAMLAGLVRGPAFYSPFTKPENAEERQRIVLARMADLGIITKEAAATALNEKIILARERVSNRQAPYFTTMVIERITELFDDGAELLHRGGLSIYTTLDLNMQRVAEEALQNGLKDFDLKIEGALVAIDPHTGQIKALIGGRDFNKSQLNRVVLARRQPGSAFKPFLYAAAIDKGYTAASVILWEPVSIKLPNQPPWEPSEFDGNEYHGQWFTLKEGLAKSRNNIAAKLIYEIGPEVAAKYAMQLGIKSDMLKTEEGGPFLSLALGTAEVNPLEITSAYGVFATNGIKAEPYYISRIVDKDGRVLLENRPQSNIVLDERTAFIVTDMLQSVILPGGTAGNVNAIINRPGAGKTGTTNNLKDAWFIGYTPQLVAGVYIGDDENKISVGASGGAIAAPIWANFIAGALKNVPPTDFPEPPGVVRVKICSDTGLLATPQSPNPLEIVFVVGTEPTEPCPVHPSAVPEETGPRQFDNYFNWFFNW